ncbi:MULTISPECIES: hypothetical protein [unclassified Xanthomonas]|uniref:hypothetical protein n=1 Tax=unclassified Xanthomonas TaxID=2643310 RepID=UPI002A838F46|nr:MULTISPECIES: hypothetical protein [unclassified Xanthomonas]MDY4298092.1 hypothetical protein [Xanthomonas sp. LF02-5]MDY4359841.1 hypothetical protein [Xanthomonas sp. LF04-12]
MVSKAVSVLQDQRVGCVSVMTEVPVGRYLELVDAAYSNRGGIEGQREPLRTTSALRIRRRMVEDIQKGAVLPPVVIGVVLQPAQFSELSLPTYSDVETLLRGVDNDKISIIDGMQRSTAIREAFPDAQSSNYEVRVEFWIADKINSLLYRMLVLNTGQVPWNLRRQVEVIFNSVTKQIEESVTSVTILRTDDAKRRTRGGVYQADDLIELFLVFGARKEKVDVRKQLSDEYTRLDLIEASSEQTFVQRFCDLFELMARLDVAFDMYKGADYSAEGGNREGESSRFQKGYDLFSSQPARVGFVTAAAVYLYGRPGTEIDNAKTQDRLERVKKGASDLVASLNQKSPSELGGFLRLDTLNETIVRKGSTGGVGDFEREYFFKAFQVLFEEDFVISSLEPCWRAF